VVATAAACARLGDVVPVESLVPIVSGGTPWNQTSLVPTRRAALFALERAPTAATVSALRRALNDPEGEVRSAAYRHLGALGLPEVVDMWMRDGVGVAAMPAVLEAAYANIGDATPPVDVSPGALRVWWTERRAGLTGCVWDGRPASPSTILSAIADAKRGPLARYRLELMTGVDVVDAAAMHVPGDSHDVARASAWWATREATWKVGALYRSGRAIAIQPVVDALAAR
jgi:hypothetical protein